MTARDVIIRPLVTEKNTDMMAQGKYAFEVALKANKTQIKQAVEEIFNVKVRKVSTARMPGKVRRRGRTVGRTPERKKAIVTVAEGQQIPIFEGL